MDEEEKKAIMNFIAIRMNMKQIMVMVLLVLAVSVTFSQNVTNVSFHQEGNKVVITYDLDKTADISVYMSSNGGESFGDALQHVTGAVGKNVPAGIGKRIEYDVFADSEKLQGEDFVFKVSVFCDTQACFDAPTIVDYDGNVYNTVQIGDQCWMKENLRTTHYSDGTYIELGRSASFRNAYRYYPHNDSSNVSLYGYLYNWKAVIYDNNSSNESPVCVQGICPLGWHVPSDAEWTLFTHYVSGQSAFQCGNNPNYIAKALASTKGWRNKNNEYFDCIIGGDTSSNNATGFSALPAGFYQYYGHGYFHNFGLSAYFWSSTENWRAVAYERDLSIRSERVFSNSFNKDCGLSVRCIRD